MIEGGEFDGGLEECMLWETGFGLCIPVQVSRMKVYWAVEMITVTSKRSINSLL